MANGELAVVEQPQITLEDIKKYIAPNATDKELFMFQSICNSYGLNPAKREIHFVKYGTSAANIVVGYEVYLKRAERTGMLDGWDVETLDGGGRAKITIYRKDRKYPLVWEVDREEFDKAQSTWKAMPNFMLKKVAIAQGMRLAFPEELGGMPYLPEEILADGSTEKLPASNLPEAVEKSKEIKKVQAKPKVTTVSEWHKSMSKAKEVMGEEMYYTILGDMEYHKRTDIPIGKQEEVLQALRDGFAKLKEQPDEFEQAIEEEGIPGA